MSVTKRRMEPGSFTVNLKPTTPRWVTDQLNLETQGFAHLAVTPVWVAPHFFNTAANLLGVSIFTGVIRERESRTSYSGAHVSVLLGDEDGKGQLVETAVPATQTFSAWMTALKPASVMSNGSYNADATTKTWTFPVGQSRRDAIDYICQLFGYEWRVADNLYLHGDTAANLYGATDVVLTPWADGFGDVDYRAVRATLGSVQSVEDFTSKVLVKDDASAVSTATIGSNPYQDQLGVDWSWKRWIDGSSSVASGTGSAMATQQLARFDHLSQRITARSDQRAIMNYVECGQNVYAYDPDNDVYDLTVEVYWRGRIIHPVEVPVHAITMPLEEGMGVYVRLNGSSPDVVDLTPYVDWESPGASLELGAPRRRLGSAMAMRGINRVAEVGYQ